MSKQEPESSSRAEVAHVCSTDLQNNDTSPGFRAAAKARLRNKHKSPCKKRSVPNFQGHSQYSPGVIKKSLFIPGHRLKRNNEILSWKERITNAKWYGNGKKRNDYS
ncbi:hypothetical protein AVEN_206785-1 [Araneus ventricosus]|uniref:Uncharacterized protein n=1 Tax=Araneus ventricosus TaxID=182803 RepID=A0A4Y2C4I5_ARAVE|nr:hypothetical protein AVEN_206785-1 [Araneus ventricosus]